MQPRLIFFGAFDRHNFGDLLLAHCARAAHPGREAIFAGLARGDLRRHGGHLVGRLVEIVQRYGDEPAEFVHVGGETLTTTAWEAAVMLQTPAEAARAIARFDRDTEGARTWAEGVLGCSREAPYVVGQEALPAGWRVRFTAVGGVALEHVAATLREEVFVALRSAAALSVRDARTLGSLTRAGIAAELVPDPAAATAQLFAGRIARRARRGEPAELWRRFPRGWLAVQLAAEWGDDGTLDRVAAELRNHARTLNWGVVLFRAGTAPWHDDAGVLERLAARLGDVPSALLRSTHVFDICAVLARARAYLGSSLHGWIVADSFGVPGVCVVSGADAKAAAYLDTWAPRSHRSDAGPMHLGSIRSDGPEGRAWRTPEELGR